jgi:hypothetical protein
MRIRGTSLVGLAGSIITTALFAMSGCGGDDKREELNPSTGGSTAASTEATGGTTNTDAAAGGTTGTDTGTSAGVKCAKTAVTDPKIAPGTNGTWGAATGSFTNMFSYAMTEPKLTSDVATTEGVIRLTGTIAVGEYKGFGIPAKGCIDLTTQSLTTGVRATLGGALGGAKLNVQVQTNENYPASTDGKGACAPANWTECASAKTAYVEPFPETPTATDFPFSSFSGGLPVDAPTLSDVVGVQFHIDCPSDATAECVVDFTIGEVTLY